MSFKVMIFSLKPKGLIGFNSAKKQKKSVFLRGSNIYPLYKWNLKGRLHFGGLG